MDCRPINGRWPSSPFVVVLLVGARPINVTVTPVVTPMVTIRPPPTTSVCAKAATANLTYNLSSSNSGNLTVVVQSRTAGVSCNSSGPSTGECWLLLRRIINGHQRLMCSVVSGQYS